MTIGTEQNALSVRGPSHDRIRVRMEGSSPRDTAGGRHGEDVGVAVVFAGEGEGFAIRRKYRELSMPAPEVSRVALPPLRLTLHKSPA